MNFLYSVFEVSHVEFQAYDLNDHKLLFSSGLAHKILGYPVGEYFQLSNNFFEELIHPDDRNKVRETVDRIYASKQDVIVEMTVRLKKHDGNYIWVYSRQMVTERDPRGAPSTIVRVSEDVTKFIELQDQFRQKVEQLKTISYKNSHLLRSPVASIVGLISLVEEQGITSEHNIQIFRYLRQAIEKLDTVIHEINDIAHL